MELQIIIIIITHRVVYFLIIIITVLRIPYCPINYVYDFIIVLGGNFNLIYPSSYNNLTIVILVLPRDYVEKNQIVFKFINTHYKLLDIFSKKQDRESFFVCS